MFTGSLSVTSLSYIQPTMRPPVLSQHWTQHLCNIRDGLTYKIFKSYVVHATVDLHNIPNASPKKPLPLPHLHDWPTYVSTQSSDDPPSQFPVVAHSLHLHTTLTPVWCYHRHTPVHNNKREVPRWPQRSTQPRKNAHARHSLPSLICILRTLASCSKIAR